MTTTALVLVGHGSHLNAHTAGIVWSYVDQLRAWNVADEVTACFWKEAPEFHQVLGTLTAETVVVVPVFTSSGAFAQTIIPVEMQLDGPVTQRDGRTLYYTAALGEHPYLGEIVRQRIDTVMRGEQLDPAEVAIAIIGHGTTRNRASRLVAEQQADSLRADGSAAEVAAVFLDDEPPIRSLYTTTRAPVIIAVPFFLANGTHATVDVPAELGAALADFPTTVRGRTVHYTPPLGTDDSICRLILELARSAGVPLQPRPARGAWASLPGYGADRLLARLRQAGSFTFGQLDLTPERATRVNSHDTSQTLTTPGDLRRFIRDTPFRPLATRTDLPDGWHVPVNGDLSIIPAVIETVYPGALADWARGQQGTFAPHPPERWRLPDDLGEAAIEATVTRVCGACVRQPTWFAASAETDMIPCPAPCNWWLSAARD